MKPWFEDFKELVRSDKVLEFWPTNNQTPADRLNAASRFVIYAACVVYLIRRDPRIFILAGTVIGVLYVMYRSNMIKSGSIRAMSAQDAGDCMLPTMDNPMGNALLSDSRDRDSACYYPTVKEHVKYFGDDKIQYDSGRSRTSLPEYQRSSSNRQFITMPVTSIPGDQTAYAEWLYGPKFGAVCKSGDMSACDPNNRGAQLEAFAGLSASGDRRLGMFGGSA